MIQTDVDMGPKSLGLKAGDLAEVRGEQQTHAALDERGELANVPMNARQAAARAGTAWALDMSPSCPWPTLIRHVKADTSSPCRRGGLLPRRGSQHLSYTYSDTTWRGHRDDNCG